MTDDAWWNRQAPENLSQGDVFTGVKMASTKEPFRYLKKQTIKGGADGWSNHKEDENGELLAKYVTRDILVLSHSCEIDKMKSNKRVLIAQINTIETFSNGSNEMADNIRYQKVYSIMPLPNLPLSGEYALDLKSISSIELETLNKGSYVASMTDLSLRILSAHIIAFFTRAIIPEEISNGIHI
jgi:hypothetical protein